MKTLLISFCLLVFSGVCLADDYEYRERYEENSTTFEGRRRPANPFRAIGELGGTIIRAPIEITRGIGSVVSGKKVMGETSYKVRHDASGRKADYRGYPYDPEGRLPQNYGNYNNFNPLLNGGFVPGVGQTKSWGVNIGNRGFSGHVSGGHNPFKGRGDDQGRHHSGHGSDD